MILLVTAASEIEIVTSVDERGAYSKSTIFPWILPIIKEEDEWEKACCITCIAIKPGAKKVMKGKPKTSPLSLPMARLKTNKKRREVISGVIIVWIATIRNLRTSFL